MIVPKNEGKVCEAVVRALEKWTRVTRADVRRPERDGVGQPVDLRVTLGATDYAIEHTRIESFENQIGAYATARVIMRHVREHLPIPFLSAACYELQFPLEVSLPEGKARRDRALRALVDWVRESELILRQRYAERTCPRCYPYTANDVICGTPPGFTCGFELLQWPNARLTSAPPGTLSWRFIVPDDREQLLADRLRQAFARKCPKLRRCRAEGVRTVLVLESGDGGPSSFEFRNSLLPTMLTEHGDAPDEIFLVETAVKHHWRVRLLKRDGDHWPHTGMPELGVNYYGPEPSSGLGVREWLDSRPAREREALQLDSLHTPCLRGWEPLSFEEDELDDLTTGRA